RTSARDGSPRRATGASRSAECCCSCFCSVYGDAMAIDYEAEYNNRIRIAEYPAIIDRWKAASALAREAAYTDLADLADLDRPYGPGERQRYDLYRAGEHAAPLIVYIHGGYWQLGSRQDTAFVARAFTAAGIDIALPSYS